MKAPVSTGKVSRISTPVSAAFHVKIGMRNMVMPGARMHTTVVMKLTAPRIEDRPVSARPRIHKSPPMPGDRTASESGT